MDPLEEQQQEIEILESIYPDELTVLSESHFTINLLLDVESDRKHALELEVKYPPTYPEVEPELKLDFGNLKLNTDMLGDDSDYEYDDDDDDDDDDNDDHEHHKLLHLIETIELDKDDLNELLRKIKVEAEENVGMPSIFTLASSLKDQAEVLFNEKLQQEEIRVEKEREAREREEQKKFIGTTVTAETFESWRINFRKEMGHDVRLDERFKAVHKDKLTGKQIFERGLATDADIDSDVTAIKKGIETTTI